jgi:hypothetical protein
LLGPAFVAAIVKLQVLPTDGVGLLTVFTCKSCSQGTGVGVTVDVLSAGVGSFSLPVIVHCFHNKRKLLLLWQQLFNVALAPLAKFNVASWCSPCS